MSAISATGWRHVLRLAVWTAGLVVAVRLLLAAGTASLAVPLTSLDDLSAWASETPPADMAMAVLRLGAIAAVFYLLAVTALATVAHLLRLHGAVALLGSISPRVVQRIVTGGSGIGLVVGGMVGALTSPTLPPGPVTATVTTAPATRAAPATPPTPAAPATATMLRLPDATATMTRHDAGATSKATPAGGPTGPATGTTDHAAGDPPAGDPPAGSATMTRLAPGGTDPSTAAAPPVGVTRAAAHGHDAGSAAPPATPAAPAIDPTTWIVEPGDSFWSIAEEATATADGSPADERTIDRYWQALIDANRARLVDPQNPDVLLPGQHLVVPPPTG